MATRLGTAKDAGIQAFQDRQAIKNGDFSPFIKALAFALMKDGLLDFISAVPVVGLVSEALGLFITVYLFVFLFGKGKWKVRIVIFILGLFDSIPLVSVIPFSTVCVLYAYKQAKAEADRAALRLAVFGTQTNAEMIREYQQARAEAAAEEAERAARMAQEAANDAEFTRAPLRNVV